MTNTELLQAEKMCRHFSMGAVAMLGVGAVIGAELSPAGFILSAGALWAGFASARSHHDLTIASHERATTTPDISKS